VAPLEPWEKVLVDSEVYPETVHGQIACVECHLGDDTAEEKAVAHEGLIHNPSNEPEATCGECHPNVVEVNDQNLHITLEGYHVMLDARSRVGAQDELQTMFNNHCNDCHSSCGECHVSQPDLVGGGLVSGHMFNRTPSMTQNCTACHGSRIGNEFLGKHEGLKPDVHFSQGRMTCVDCHDGAQMHGESSQCQDCHTTPPSSEVPPKDHMYGGVQQPRCETCHVNQSLGDDGIRMHEQHSGDLSCEVCHSIEYTSCDGCHVAISETTGNPFYATDGSYLSFAIGKNPLKSYDRPYEYVTLRHVPVDHESFAFYGDNLLENFEALPTWKYTTPHNIQRVTPQAETCIACHTNPDLFLTSDKVAPEEFEANLFVIVGEDELPTLDDLRGDPRDAARDSLLGNSVDNTQDNTESADSALSDSSTDSQSDNN